MKCSLFHHKAVEQGGGGVEGSFCSVKVMMRVSWSTSLFIRLYEVYHILPEYGRSGGL